MDMDKPFSQIESRMVADWLRREKKLHVSNSLYFWRKRPSITVDWIRKDWKVTVTAEDVCKAAGREN